MTEEDFFAGAGDTRLCHRSWRPQGDPRAIVVVVHGWKAHSGMYEWPAQQLVREGFAVHAADLRGHGKSDGERYHVDAFDDYVTDLRNLVALVRSREGARVPLFVLGHSAGGVIGCLYALLQQETLAGFICEDFAYEIPPPEVALALLKGVAHLAPHAHLLNLKDEDFSRDPAFVERMRTDPLAINTPGTVQTLAELIRADERLRTAFPRITLPLLIMHGTGDHVAKAQGSQFFFDNAGSKDKTLKLYEGHYHDLLNDVGKERVMADVLHWQNAHLQAQAVASL
jgi:alpha-beta hydrolase superfamily lysophospholipase